MSNLNDQVHLHPLSCNAITYVSLSVFPFPDLATLTLNKIAVINLCELKQTRARTTGREINCSEVDIHELKSDNVCPDCSVEILKLEKKYQVVERYVGFSFGCLGPLRGFKRPWGIGDALERVSA